MIHYSNPSNFQDQVKTTTGACDINCDQPSKDTSTSEPLVAIGFSSDGSKLDGSEPSSVPISKRAIAPMTKSDILSTATKVKEKINEDLQSLSEELIICDNQIARFKSDYTQIRLWQSGLFEKFPKGMILSSPPGHGKTVFMQAIGNMIVGDDKECVQFLKGTDLLVEMPEEEILDKYLSEAKLSYKNSLEGSEHRKCFVYCIDEIDSAFMKGSKHDTTPQQDACRNTIQSLMDGGTELSLPNIYLIGTTNEPIKKFHEALLRPGRFATHISFEKVSSENIEKLIKFYLKAHPTITISNKDIPFVCALYEGMTPAEIKGQIDKVATWSITEAFSIAHEDGEQTVEKYTVPFAAFKKMLFPDWQIDENFSQQVKQLQRVHPYYQDLSYASSQMKESLSLITDIANRKAVGMFSIILLQGKTGCGKTAFLHELLQRFKAEDKDYLVDNYSVIKSVRPSDRKYRDTERNLSATSISTLCSALDEHHCTICAIDDGEWLAGPHFLPCSGTGIHQYDPSLFINEWNHTENRNKKSKVILLVTFDRKSFLRKLDKPLDSGSDIASEFKAATGLNGVIEGAINLPETIEGADIDQLINKFTVDDSRKMTKILKKHNLPIKQLISLMSFAKDQNETIYVDKFKNLLKLNCGNGSKAPDYFI
ncbi:ATP-binding protein [Endozoicomonas sp. ONNA2]|uniref:AAA family ATPase n=1 Tax=Endozoicomonas sp. ONNA2 TaxID=2828741 RepID=UPI0021474AE6|nr:ATP-binding protein [Endozoicomonas sp. ONNA2]